MSIKLANHFYQSGDFEKALAEYQKIPENHPLYEQAQFNVGFILKKIPKLKFKANKIEKLSENIVNSIPLVSVVMPVFNVAPYLDASIMSVLNQTYQNIELIIVNDASTDNSLDIIHMYEKWDSRIRVINLEFNTLGGAGIPSNIGVDNAKGEYVAYADSDDILDKFAIENLVKAALSHDAEIVIGDFCNFNNTEREIKTAYDKDRWVNIPLDTLFSPKQYPEIYRLSPVPWRKLYKRSYLNQYKIRFPEGDYFYEDNPLHWFALSSTDRVVLVDKIIAYHRMEREGQTMGTDTYKLSALFCHLNSVRKDLEKQKNTDKVYWKELSDFAYRTNWVVDKQKDEKVKSLIKKRFYQTARDINMSAGFIEKDILDIRPNYLKRLEDYNNSYPDVDLAVVIPIYNCVDLFPKLMDSLLKLPLKSEIFVVDDGSTDGSTKLCKEYAENYSHVFCFTQKNKGAGVARNVIIPLISAKYTYFVDADDDVDLTKLVEAVEFAKRNKNDLVLFKYKIHFYDRNVYRDMWDSDQKIWEQLKLAKSNDEKKIVASKMVNYPWIRLIKTELLHDEKIFFGKTIVHNDVPFHWHSIVSAKNIGVLDEAVCLHRKFEQREQITNIKDERRLAVLEAYRYTNSVLEKYDAYEMIFNSWQKSVRDLINWAKDRIPEEYLEYYKQHQKAIIEHLKKGVS